MPSEPVVEPTGARPRLLLLDDRPGGSTALVGILERSGYDVERASSAEEAVFALKRHRPVLAVVNEHFGGDACSILDLADGPQHALVVADSEVECDESVRLHPRVVAVLPRYYSLAQLRGALEWAVEQAGRPSGTA